MTKKIIICDRCGKETIDITGKIYNIRRYSLMNTINYTDLDLCQDCHNKLIKWVKGEKQNDTTNKG